MKSLVVRVLVGTLLAAATAALPVAGAVENDEIGVLRLFDEFVSSGAAASQCAQPDDLAAARFLSARLLLPFFQMPVLGAGVALALVGWIYSGLAIIALGVIAPRLIKRSAPHFLLQNALEDERIHDELMRQNIMRVSPGEKSQA